MCMVLMIMNLELILMNSILIFDTQLTKDRYFENGTRFIFNSNKELIGITKNYQLLSIQLLKNLEY